QGSNPPVNRAPIADAGMAQTVVAPATVTLDGSASRDTDGTIASYYWEQIAGPTVQLSDANQAQASFSIGEVTQTEIFRFKLTVTDNEGASGSATVQITVKAEDGGVENTPPVAIVSAPSEVRTGEQVLVDASASYDAQQETLSFDWQVPTGLEVQINGSQLIFTAGSYSV
ncbi:PKD domain-containing protein, partial [Vibrio parahaemolyticus]|nr:PKD domain-containing protein [Vibrio parahaemolyticus]